MNELKLTYCGVYPKGTRKKLFDDDFGALKRNLTVKYQVFDKKRIFNPKKRILVNKFGHKLQIQLCRSHKKAPNFPRASHSTGTERNARCA